MPCRPELRLHRAVLPLAMVVEATLQMQEPLGSELQLAAPVGQHQRAGRVAVPEARRHLLTVAPRRSWLPSFGVFGPLLLVAAVREPAPAPVRAKVALSTLPSRDPLLSLASAQWVERSPLTSCL
jgi:hypothetical protein